MSPRLVIEMALFRLAPWKREKEPAAVAAQLGEPEDAHEKAREEARMRVVYESMQRALGRRSANPPRQQNDFCPQEW